VLQRNGSVDQAHQLAALPLDAATYKIAEKHQQVADDRAQGAKRFHVGNLSSTEEPRPADRQLRRRDEEDMVRASWRAIRFQQDVDRAAV
jgi:hypothetical protein